MIAGRRQFASKRSLYGMSSFHFYRQYQFKTIPCSVRRAQETYFPHFRQRPICFSSLASDMEEKQTEFKTEYK